MQLQSGPYDIPHCLDCLSDAAREARQGTGTVKSDPHGSFIKQFDATRDLKGTFYAVGSYKDPYEQLKSLLEQSFGVKLTNNRNTFNSCFQYNQLPQPHAPYMLSLIHI